MVRQRPVNAKRRPGYHKIRACDPLQLAPAEASHPKGSHPSRQNPPQARLVSCPGHKEPGNVQHRQQGTACRPERSHSRHSRTTTQPAHLQSHSSCREPASLLCTLCRAAHKRLYLLEPGLAVIGRRRGGHKVQTSLFNYPLRMDRGHEVRSIFRDGQHPSRVVGGQNPVDVRQVKRC